MKTEFDVIIVGAGVNGLACGAYLAKAGLEVLVLEKRNECGPFALTEDIFGAGAITDTHAAVCFLPMGPAYGDLELDRFGFDLIIGKASGAAVWKDGKNLVFYYDPTRMTEAIAQFSRRDAETAQRIGQQLRPQLIEILERAIFREPSAEGLEFLWSLGAHAGLTPAEVRSLNGIELLDRLYESEHVKMTFLAVADIGLFGDVTQKGEGAVAVLLGPALAVGTPRGGMHNLVHALVRCFRSHGGTLQLNAPVAHVEFEGGVARRVVLAEESPYPGHEFRARRAVVLHVTPPVALPMLGEDVVRSHAPELHRKMAAWSMTGHCAFISHFLVRGLPRWGSAAWNPDVGEVPFLLRAWDSWAHAQASLQKHHDEDTMAVLGDVGELYNQAAQDASRVSRDGCCTVSLEIEYPVTLPQHGGFGRWDDRELIDRVHAAHLDLLDGLAPGFRSQVVDSLYYTPLDNWRRNASAVYGHELGGDASGAQWYMGRMPVRGLPGLYFSNGIWPASLTHLGPGYIAACEIAKDLGVRRQPWWRYRPLEYALERAATS